MKKIDINHENLANDKLKAKKLWKKPELTVLGIEKTNNSNTGPINDGNFQGTASE
jgi:hypothetical protein